MFDELNPAADHLYPQEENPKPISEPILQVSTTSESQKESNMRILRERAEAAERRAQDLERLVQSNLSHSEQKTKIQLIDEDDDIDISDDSYVEGKQIKKYIKSLKRQIKTTEEKFEKYNQQASVTQAELLLKSQFADFDSVVSKENLDRLALSKPALHRTIFANPDIYDRGYAAYELIKSSGVIPTGYESIDKKLEENKSKPRSVATASPQTSDTPLARIGDYDRRILTEERKAQLRRQVEESKRNL